MVISLSLKFIDNLGAGAISFGRAAGSFCKELWAIYGLAYDTIASFFTTSRKSYDSLTRQIVSQILFTGVEAFLLIGVIALLFGLTVVIQGTTKMPQFGVGDYFGDLLVLLVVRELGPFFTSIVVIGRSGSALSTYIASMKVNREIAALEVMGIEPVRFVVMPAFIGMVISMLGLSVYFSVIAIAGGLLVAALTVGIPFMTFAEKFMAALGFWDVVLSLIKNMGFGLIIATLSCYHGLRAETIREIPRAARKGVVWSMVAAMLLNVVFTLCYYVIK
jgi:phospholipid/cholesterol/gamma-HCH transport system permease protein